MNALTLHQSKWRRWITKLLYGVDLVTIIGLLQNQNATLMSQNRTIIRESQEALAHKPYIAVPTDIKVPKK